MGLHYRENEGDTNSLLELLWMPHISVYLQADKLMMIQCTVKQQHTLGKTL